MAEFNSVGGGILLERTGRGGRQHDQCLVLKIDNGIEYGSNCFVKLYIGYQSL